jgi:hypothetical protein
VDFEWNDRANMSQVRIPRSIAVVCASVLVVASVVMISGALVSGITWDEFGLAKFLQGYLDNGWFTEPTAVINGIPDLGQIWYLNSYGPVAALPGHWLAMLFGQDQVGMVSLSAEAFSIRHLGYVLFAFLGIAAVAFTCRILLRSWAWGLFGAALMASVPLWIGHGMFNPKDIPVATACTLATLALTGMCSPVAFRSAQAKAGYGCCLFVALVIGAGTRPFIGVMIMAIAVTTLLLKICWGWFKRVGQEGTLAAILSIGLAAVSAYVALLLIYPKLYSDPVKLGIGAFLEARQFAFNEQVIVAGQWVGEPVPWWYLPIWFAAQLPLLVLIGFVAGLISWLLLALKRPWRSENPASSQVATLVPAIAQALAATSLAMVSGAVIYNGTRQYLFAVPGFVIIAVFGLSTLVGKFLPMVRSKGVRIALWSTIAVGLVAPTVAQVQLFPYTYTYYNAAAVTFAPIDGNWPTDYWRASSRELIRMIPSEGKEICAYESGLWKRQAECSREQMFLPYLNERGVDAWASSQSTDNQWVVRENQGEVALPPGCLLADEITRRNLWRTSTIAQLLECPVLTPTSVFSYPPSTN